MELVELKELPLVQLLVKLVVELKLVLPLVLLELQPLLELLQPLEQQSHP